MIDTSVDNITSLPKFAVMQGVSRQMAYKWKKDGRLILTPDEKNVYIKESIERIKLTKSLNGSFYDRKAGEERKKINEIIEEKGLSELTNEVCYQQLDLDTEDAEVLFKNARALREKATALQAAAEHEKFIGELVARDQVEKVVFERARQFRDELLTCSRRIAPDIVGKTEVKQVEDILYKEFRIILEQFSKLPVVE